MDPKKSKDKAKRTYSERVVNKARKILLGPISRAWGSYATRGLENQKRLVQKGYWDTLIILDACRYDYFEQEYASFIGKGKLRKLKSPASWTYAWLSEVFGGEYEDITVYSAHPGLNSKGIGRHMGYVGSKHFKKIIDVWDFGWDSKLGTVHPKTLTEAVLEDVSSGDFKGRNIIWYVQPHSPWIGETRLGGSRRDWNDKEVLTDVMRGIKSGEISRDTFMRAYRDNLRLVLRHVAELIPYLKGTVVISSDHGELLGEWGFYTHISYVGLPGLKEVPWLELEGGGKELEGKHEAGDRNIQEGRKDSDEEEIKKKLMGLGYM